MIHLKLAKMLVLPELFTDRKLHKLKPVVTQLRLHASYRGIHANVIQEVAAILAQYVAYTVVQHEASHR